ncbi:MAG TPA: Hsp20/alpha crystallin family protein [Solirubrobacteraceae bacterium]|nr:Hsp20/alpha crystallin family protein [Solirubrobacteraceae bacterium]
MPLPVRSREASDSRPLRRWEPFRELENLHSQMGELMDSVWAPMGAGNGVWVPTVDIEETEDAWIVEAELPGVDGKDVNVELRDSELSITGEIKERERKGILRRRSRRTGRFDFRVTLPGDADAEHIEANLKDGILTVRVPKAEQARARRIEVKAGQE